MSHLGMFAKYWQAGRVKTRLAARLGDQLAADVYLVFLEHLTNTLESCCDQRTLVVSPWKSCDLFESKFGDTWNYQPQSDGDLGNRLSDFFWQTARQTGASGKIIVIGSDTPRLGPGIISQTEQRLDSYPVVLGPSQDGGYYLVAINANFVSADIDLFKEMPWSTDQVLAETLKRLVDHGLPCHLLPEMSDVDDFTDLQRLWQELKGATGPSDQQLLERLRSAVSAMFQEGVIR